MVKFWPSRRPLKSCRIQSVTVRSIAANDANADECPGTPGMLGHGPGSTLDVVESRPGRSPCAGSACPDRCGTWFR